MPWIATQFRREFLTLPGAAYVERHYRREAVAAKIGRLYLGAPNFPGAVNERLRNFPGEMSSELQIADQVTVQ